MLGPEDNLRSALTKLGSGVQQAGPAFRLARMQRFFFDSDEAGRVLQDDDGVDLPDVDAAERQALAALGEIARDELPTRQPRYIALNVRDERGTVLLTAALSLHLQRR